MSEEQLFRVIKEMQQLALTNAFPHADLPTTMKYLHAKAARHTYIKGQREYRVLMSVEYDKSHHSLNNKNCACKPKWWVSMSMSKKGIQYPVKKWSEADLQKGKQEILKFFTNVGIKEEIEEAKDDVATKLIELVHPTLAIKYISPLSEAERNRVHNFQEGYKSN